MQKNDGDRELLQDFQFIQSGRVVQPDDGVVRLTRSGFSIRYTGKSLHPSIFVSSNPKVGEQLRSLRDFLATLTGTGSAVYPSQLYVDGNPLELYEGWSSAFEET